VALVVVGLVSTATGTLQLATGRYIGFRKLTIAPSIEKIRLGGWIGAGSGVVALLLAASSLAAGALRTGLQVTTWVVFLGGCALLLLRVQRLRGPSTDTHPPAATPPWTRIGASVALAALALMVAAAADIAIAGTFCSWPAGVTTLAGVGLIASLVPALVAIRQTLRHEPRSIAYWLMVVGDLAAVGLYLWLVSAHDQGCAGSVVLSFLK
jgi:hypothetical protein